MRFLEFFAANIRNPHTRRAYARAADEFLAWCASVGAPSIAAVQPVHVATWIEAGSELAAPSVKQRLAAIRHLFDWLVTGQVVPVNPAGSVRGPRHVVTYRLSRRRRGAWRSQRAAVPDDRPRHRPAHADGATAGECLCDDPQGGAAAGIAAKLGNHSFRATGITAYLKNGGTLEKAAAMENHASTRTTQLYDRRRDELTLDEVERIVI